MTILVTAASGHLGHLVIDALLERGAAPSDIVAGARTVAKAQDLADRGVRVVPLDFTLPESISAALDGVDSVLLVSSPDAGARLAQHVNVIDAAKAAGVSKLVYTSIVKADSSPFILAPDHKATEEAIAASGVPAVILRNNWYTENYIADVAQASESGALAAHAGDATVAAAARVDFAEAAAVVLLEDGHVGQTYELTGDTAVSYAEVAAAIGEVTGREVGYVSLTREQLEAGLAAAGLDAGTVGFVAEMQAGIARGDLSEVDPTLARLIGRPTTPFVDALRAVVAAPAATV